MMRPARRQGLDNASDENGENMNSQQQAVPVFNNRHLRFVFVAFLFSASIADVGKQAIKVFSVLPLYWPALSHLAIAFCAISISWVYWARNINEGRTQLKDIFSQEYVLLVLDLVLVFLYFGIAEAAEVPTWDPAKPGVQIRPDASAVPESLILAFVYGIYAIWDVVNDVWRKPRLPDSRPRTIGDTILVILVRSGASVFSFGVALVIVCIARSYVKNCYLGVVLLNVAELANLVLFRALKVLEFKLDKSLHPMFQEGDDKYIGVRGRMYRWSIVAGITCVCAICGALAVVWWPHC